MQTLDETTEPMRTESALEAHERAQREIPPVLPHHFPALDGIRGLAVAGVLLFHAGQLTGGYLGVDLFFVLSGFLITGLLIKEYRTKSDIRLGQFWVRRVRRLMPALLALLIGVCLWAAIVSDPVSLGRIRSDGIATLFYVANWNTIFAGHSYWELFAAPSPLEHTWSLAIEEQFYLIWPIVLWALFKFTKASLKTLLWLCLGLALVSEVVLQIVYTPENSSRAYQGTDTRGVAILLGAALATALSIWGPVRGKTPRLVLEISAALAFVALLVCWFTIDGQSDFLYRGGFLIAELLVLVILMNAVHPEPGVFSKVMGFAPFVGLGLISYGVYLYHVPIFQVLSADRVGLDGWPLTAVQIAATIAVAVGSYFILEQPIRRNGLPQRFPARFVVPAVLALTMIVIFLSTSAGSETDDLAAAGGVKAETSFANAPATAQKVLFQGDSVGFSLGVESAAATEGKKDAAVVATRALAGCSIFAAGYNSRASDKHDERNPLACQATWAADAAELKPDVSVILIGGVTKSDVQVNGEWAAPCSPKWDEAVRASLKPGIESLAQNSKHVVLLTVPHYVSWGTPEGKEWVDCANVTMRKVAEENPTVTLLDFDAYVCPGGDCQQYDAAGEKVRPDGLHFKGPGGLASAQWVLDNLPNDSGAAPKPSTTKPPAGKPAAKTPTTTATKAK